MGKRPERWSPLSLPAIRNRYVEDVDAFRSACEQNGRAAEFLDVLRNEALVASVADLYWVSQPMAQLALDASHDLPEWSIGAVMPSRNGLIVWDGDLPALEYRDAPDELATVSPLGVRQMPQVPVVAAIWSSTVTSVVVRPLTHVRHTMPLIADLPRGARDVDTFRGLAGLGVKTPPLPLDLPYGHDDYAGPAGGLIAALGATWLLMSQPTVSDLRRERVGRGALRDPPDRASADVSIVDLRRLAVDRTGETAVDGERIYRHRWLVRGHWRQQAHGPGRSQRKPVWIESHIKGPAGAPLLASERVMVWRR